MTVEIPKEKWSGQVREVTVGASSDQGGTRTSTLTVGGESTLPYLQFEGSLPYAPAIAIEILDQEPVDWSPLLLEAWGDVVDDPAEWAKAAEQAGADMIYLTLSLKQPDGSDNTPENARAVVRKVLDATGLPLTVAGPGQAEIDNELLVPVAEEAKGERIVLGICEEGNYRTIVAAALAHDHLVQSRTPMDVNLSKQLVILINDMGLPLERILMDPTTGALGYGIEYGYSVMERLRLAALQGDKMTQQPMMVTVGEETWKVKEAKVGDGVPEEWGDWERRAKEWEALTAITLLHSGADIIVLRHPENVKRVRSVINQLLEAEAAS